MALVTVTSDPLALVLLKPPAEFGADIVIGNAQRFGVPMGYGGPHAAFFATRDQYKRSMPGRIIGVSVDAQGRHALRMALQTREQHIRREKATSNICTAQVLLANISALYAMYHGPAGLTTIALRVHRMTQILAAGLEQLAHPIVDDIYFDTIKVRAPGLAGKLAARARESRINLRLLDADHLGITLDETTKRENIETLWNVFATHTSELPDITSLDQSTVENLPQDLQRSTALLEHANFHRYHSETEMMRYLRRTASKDVSLVRAFAGINPRLRQSAPVCTA